MTPTMAEIPADVMKKAHAVSGVIYAHHCIKYDPDAALRTIAHAIMEAVEAERERCAKVVVSKAKAIEADERDARSWGGPDPRGPHASHYRLEQARELHSAAAAISKGASHDQA